MNDIKNYDAFTIIEPVNKGWSNEKKHYIETADGKRLLLRIADISELNRKKDEYEAVKQMAALGIPMSQPVDFGLCDNNRSVYSLLTWCDGEDAEAILPLLSETEQYAMGVKAGEILRKIHSIPAPETQETWDIRFNRKSTDKINRYRTCGIQIEDGEKLIAYIEHNRQLLENRPQSLQHGDYHVGNMVISPDQALSIIDFNRMDYGDPWEEFDRIVWSAVVSPYFATGQINGYFEGNPPLSFFKLLTFYIASNALSSVYWAIPFGEEEVRNMLGQAKSILQWFDGMRNPIPSWYHGEVYMQEADGVPYRLKSPFDFSFLKKYGKVFKVFDHQDSGNICFGIQDDDQKYFIKFAGAPTVRAGVSAEEAVANLEPTVTIYQDLIHPNLVRLIDAEEIGKGFAIRFEWTDADCMHGMYPLSNRKFMQMPMESKLRVFDDILAFHAHVAERDYVAIDFYDGSIMYDFQASKTIICDIDCYRKNPYINHMGRLWGSSRFMSPEEFQLGAEIDEISNVYVMGATAFVLFGGGRDRSEDKWVLSKALFHTAAKAVSDDRAFRHQSITQLIAEWNEVKAINRDSDQKEREPELNQRAVIH